MKELDPRTDLTEDPTKESFHERGTKGPEFKVRTNEGLDDCTFSCSGPRELDTGLRDPENAEEDESRLRILTTTRSFRSSTNRVDSLLYTLPGFLFSSYLTVPLSSSSGPTGVISLNPPVTGLYYDLSTRSRSTVSRKTRGISKNRISRYLLAS